jgi:hypothetical protein
MTVQPTGEGNTARGRKDFDVPRCVHDLGKAHGLEKARTGLGHRGGGARCAATSRRRSVPARLFQLRSL